MFHVLCFMLHASCFMLHASCSMSLLSIRNLRVCAGDKEIVKGVNLDIGEGEVHAIMGPNGSGKSTLLNAIAGHPGLKIESGNVEYKGKDLLKMQPHERARAGIFLAFQHPRDIEGVSLRSFLFASYTAQMAVRFPEKRKISPITFQALLNQKMEELGINSAFADRSVNKGFSGGEKKKAEILQMLVLEPDLVLLDETDAGLDMDAMRVVARGISSLRLGARSFLIITHNFRILDYVKPDFIHVMQSGRITESGDINLVLRIEGEGYAKDK